MSPTEKPIGEIPLWLINTLPPPLLRLLLKPKSAKNPKGGATGKTKKAPNGTAGQLFVLTFIVFSLGFGIYRAIAFADEQVEKARAGISEVATRITANKTPNTSAIPSSHIPHPPICGGGTNQQFLPEKGITTVTVPMDKACFGGYITTPADWPHWDYQGSANKGFWIWFLGDEEPIWLPPDSVRDFGNKRGIFRTSGEGNLYVKIRR